VAALIAAFMSKLSKVKGPAIDSNEERAYAAITAVGIPAILPLSAISDPPSHVGALRQGQDFWAADRWPSGRVLDCDVSHKPLNFHLNYSPSETNSGLLR